MARRRRRNEETNLILLLLDLLEELITCLSDNKILEHKTSIASAVCPNAIFNLDDSFKMSTAASGSTTLPELTDAESCFNRSWAPPDKYILPSIVPLDSSKLSCLANNDSASFLFPIQREKLIHLKHRDGNFRSLSRGPTLRIRSIFRGTKLHVDGSKVNRIRDLLCKGARELGQAKVLHGQKTSVTGETFNHGLTTKMGKQIDDFSTKKSTIIRILTQNVDYSLLFPTPF